MKKFYFHDGSTQQGPFDIEDLKTKKLTKNTPVWYEGLKEWTIAGEVDELKGILIVTPPPITKNSMQFQPVSNSNPQNYPSIQNPEPDNSLKGNLFLIGGIILFGLLGFWIFNLINNQQTQNEIERIRNNITFYVTSENSDYRYSDLGGIYDLSISVNNNSDYLIDEVKVQVIYIKANGDVWDTRIVDFNFLNPHTKNTIKVPDTERGTSIKHEIVSIKSAALGLN